MRTFAEFREKLLDDAYTSAGRANQAVTRVSGWTMRERHNARELIAQHYGPGPVRPPPPLPQRPGKPGPKPKPAAGWEGKPLSLKERARMEGVTESALRSRVYREKKAAEEGKAKPTLPAPKVSPALPPTWVRDDGKPAAALVADDAPPVFGLVQRKAHDHALNVAHTARLAFTELAQAAEKDRSLAPEAHRAARALARLVLWLVDDATGFDPLAPPEAETRKKPDVVRRRQPPPPAEESVTAWDPGDEGPSSMPPSSLGNGAGA